MLGLWTKPEEFCSRWACIVLSSRHERNTNATLTLTINNTETSPPLERLQQSSSSPSRSVKECVNARQHGFPLKRMRIRGRACLHRFGGGERLRHGQVSCCGWPVARALPERDRGSALTRVGTVALGLRLPALVTGARASRTTTAGYQEDCAFLYAGTGQWGDLQCDGSVYLSSPACAPAATPWPRMPTTWRHWRRHELIASGS